MTQASARYRTGILLALCLLGDHCASTAWAQPPTGTDVRFEPDPAAVTRQGPGWRFPQDGWIVVHVEGTPYERGYQHGRLLAHEIVDFCHTIAKLRSAHAPDKAWHDLRLFVNALFLRRFDNEYLREMQGIADGAAAAGAKFDGRLLDLIDIVVINADVEVSFLDGTIAAVRSWPPVLRQRMEKLLPGISPCQPLTMSGSITSGSI